MRLVDVSNLQKQLNSQNIGTVNLGLKAIVKNKLREDQLNQLREDIVRIFNLGSPYNRDLVQIICGYPFSLFGEFAIEVLRKGNFEEQALALQWMTIWIEKADEKNRNEVRDIVLELARADRYWIAFLATMQAVHIFLESPSFWLHGAMAIEKSRLAFTTDITTQVQELYDLNILSEEDIRHLNQRLVASDTPVIEHSSDQRELLQKILEQRYSNK